MKSEDLLLKMPALDQRAPSFKVVHTRQLHDILLGLIGTGSVNRTMRSTAQGQVYRRRETEGKRPPAAAWAVAQPYDIPVFFIFYLIIRCVMTHTDCARRKTEGSPDTSPSRMDTPSPQASPTVRKKIAVQVLMLGTCVNQMLYD